MQQLIANKLLNQEVVSALILTHLLQNKQPVEHFFFFAIFIQEQLHLFVGVDYRGAN